MTAPGSRAAVGDVAPGSAPEAFLNDFGTVKRTPATAAGSARRITSWRHLPRPAARRSAPRCVISPGCSRRRHRPANSAGNSSGCVPTPRAKPSWPSSAASVSPKREARCAFPGEWSLCPPHAEGPVRAGESVLDALRASARRFPGRTADPPRSRCPDLRRTPAGDREPGGDPRSIGRVDAARRRRPRRVRHRLLRRAPGRPGVDRPRCPDPPAAPRTARDSPSALAPGARIPAHRLLFLGKRGRRKTGSPGRSRAPRLRPRLSGPAGDRLVRPRRGGRVRGPRLRFRARNAASARDRRRSRVLRPAPRSARRSGGARRDRRPPAGTARCSRRPGVSARAAQGGLHRRRLVDRGGRRRGGDPGRAGAARLWPDRVGGPRLPPAAVAPPPLGNERSSRPGAIDLHRGRRNGRGAPRRRGRHHSPRGARGVRRLRG